MAQSPTDFGKYFFGGGQAIQGFADLFSGLFNANQTDKQAKYAQQRKSMQIADVARQYAAVQGQAQTGIAKNGMMVDGSARDVLMANASNYGRDVGRIKGQAHAEVKALRSQAKMQRIGGAFGAASSWLGAGNTFFGSPDNLYGTQDDKLNNLKLKSYGARRGSLPGGGDI